MGGQRERQRTRQGSGRAAAAGRIERLREGLSLQVGETVVGRWWSESYSWCGRWPVLGSRIDGEEEERTC